MLNFLELIRRIAHAIFNSVGHVMDLISQTNLVLKLTRLATMISMYY